MFGKGNFDGQFRSTPTVSIRGASKSESKEQLLQRAQEQRNLREVQRKETSAAIKIQSFVRGFLTRCRHRQMVKHQLNTWKQSVDASGQTPDPESLLKAGMLVVSSSGVDGVVFAWYTQLLVRQRQVILQVIPTDAAWQVLICKLLGLAMEFLLNSSEIVASSLRFVQIYTDLENYSKSGLSIVIKIYKYLIQDSYFSKVRDLVDLKIPPLISVTVKPPTPISEEILLMITRPLCIIDKIQDKEIIYQLLRQFCENLFCKELSEQVKLFILPSLSCHPNLPLNRLVQSLVTNDLSLAVSNTSCMLYSLLLVSSKKLGNIHANSEQSFLTALAHLCSGAFSVSSVSREAADSDDESDSGMDIDDPDHLIEQCLELLNDREFVSYLIQICDKADTPTSTLIYLASICHSLLLAHPQALHRHCLLFSLAFRPSFLRLLWTSIISCCQPAIFGSPTPLITLLARGIKLAPHERDEIVPQLAVFSSLFGYLLVTIHDTEFYTTASTTPASRAWMPFTLSQLVPMALSLRDIALGLVELAFPESRPSVKEEYKQAVRSVRAEREDNDTSPRDVAMWSHMFKAVVGLVRQLYNRDSRRQFCPSSHWISPRIALPIDRPQDISFRRSRIRAYRPFQGLRVFTRDELEETGPPLTTREVRLATVLRELPFTISFSQRVLVFQNMVHRDKQEHQGDRVNFMQGPHIDLLVRRDYIYEDSFDKLSPENEPNLKLKMRIQLVNVAGLDEAGIDGGGLFREFLSLLLKAAFDPNRGFFALTRDQMLYPNPAANQIHGNSSPHYYFIGRILGKALYENLLVELPLATFFLSKLLGQTLVNVDIDHLDSLDPELYRNLLYLKTYDGDVQDLGLDFTIAVDDFGENRIELLKPDGDNITVTNENRIEYIHLVADYKLNKQIRHQCNAFRAGLSDMISLDWLRMFSSKELSTLVSGAEHEISVTDLQAHTNYSGGYDVNHPTITAFWHVVNGFDESQKRSLLKFVTSCSRPPLLGFKDLDPPFCIQNAGNEAERLPTASTCMNLLKLPDFKDAAVLKRKLLYAIESGAGFELS